MISTPGSAREALTQFQAGFGDALLTYELDALLAKRGGAPIEMIVPRATIFSEHVVAIVDRNVDVRTRPLVEAFVSYLWSAQAQQSFAKTGLRPATAGTRKAPGKEFADIEMPFTVEALGGWSRAYPEIVEGVWRDQVKKSQ